jgi:hypothetical protein
LSLLVQIIACGPDGYLGPPVDLWSVGVCLFAFLSGRLPFLIADEVGDWRFAKVAAAQACGDSACAEILSWVGQQGTVWSEPATRLLDSLLMVDPLARPTAAVAMRTGWLHFNAINRSVSSPALSPALAPAQLPTIPAVGTLPTRTHSSPMDPSPVPAPPRAPSPPSLRGAPNAAADAAARDRFFVRITRSRSASLDVMPPPLPVPQTGDGDGAAAGRVCSYTAKRKRSAAAQAAEERTQVWRGVEAANRSEMLGGSATAYPKVSARYEVMAHAAKAANGASASAFFHWLRDDRGYIALVDVDRPFKVQRANNNNYFYTFHAGTSSAPHFDHQSTPAEHPSRRMCPWGR